jgi:hypothetical protein
VDGALGTGAVTVQNGGTLDGAGMIAGPVTVNGGGTLGAGDASAIGTFAIVNTLTLNDGSTTMLRLDQADATNDSVSDITTLTYGGTLAITNLAGIPAAGNSFPLFNAAAYAGNFAATNLPALASGLAWNWTPANGVLSVVSTIPTSPTNLACSVSSGFITLSWPSDYTGWILQAQTNPPTVGITTNWVDVADTGSVDSLTLSISTTNSVFFRMRHP